MAKPQPSFMYPPDETLVLLVAEQLALIRLQADAQQKLDAKTAQVEARVLEILRSCKHEFVLERGRDEEYLWATKNDTTVYQGAEIILWQRCWKCKLAYTAWVELPDYVDVDQRMDGRHIYQSAQCAFCFSLMRKCKDAKYIAALERYMRKHRLITEGDINLSGVYECTRCSKVHPATSWAND